MMEDLVDADRIIPYIGGDWATTEEVQTVLGMVEAETLTINETVIELFDDNCHILRSEGYNLTKLEVATNIETRMREGE